MQNILNKIIKYIIYVLVFLVPLFWLPFSFEVLEFNKQFLIFFLVSIGFFAWLAKMVFVDKELRFRCTPLDVPVLIFLLVAILSTIFSLDRTSSIFGFYGRFSDGLIGLLSLVVFYFLITNSVISHHSLVKIFTLSIFFVVLISYLSVFGVWQKIPNLPPIMFQINFNPISGSLEGLAVFLSIAIVLLIGKILTTKFEKILPLIFTYLLLIAALGLLVIIDFNPAWIILAGSLGLFLIFSLATRIFRENVNRLLLPIFIIIVAISFLFITSIKQGFISLPWEIVLGQGSSWISAIGGVTENIKSIFLGSGMGTFYYAFTRHRPLEINQSWLWQIRFDRPGVHMAEILATTGFLGILSYLLLIGMFLLISWFLIQVRTKTSNIQYSTSNITLLMAFLALLVGQFVYYHNSTLAFTFWLVLGLGAVSWQKPVKEKVISFKNFPELSLIFSTLLILFGIAILVSYFFAGKFYLADVNYNQALNVLGSERIEKLEKAVSLNPYFSQYKVALSRTYLFEVFQELQKPAGQQDEIKIQNMIAKSINEARKAVDLQSKLVANWENLGIIYREIIGIAGGAVDWSIKSFEKAIDWEPTNPVLYTELGKLYLIKEDNNKAKEYFQKALDKKSDYADALIQEALLLEREDALDEAIERLENFIAKDPSNIEAYFQLGRLYFNDGRIDQAIELFQLVTFWVPQHSNAHYSLGIAFTAKGQTQEAIKAFEKVLELNPGNQDIIQKLEELRKPKIEMEEIEEVEEEIEE